MKKLLPCLFVAWCLGMLGCTAPTNEKPAAAAPEKTPVPNAQDYWAQRAEQDRIDRQIERTRGPDSGKP